MTPTTLLAGSETAKATSAAVPAASARGSRVLAAAPVAMLLAQFALLLSSAVQKSPTADEPMHLLAGYSSLALGDYGFSAQHHHPVLGTMLNAVPLLWVNDLKVPPTASHGGDPRPWTTQFLFEQQVPGDRLLLWCRIPTMLLSIGLGLIVYLFAKDLFGQGAACFALLLTGLSPNLLAHGSLITTDTIAALMIVVCAWAMARYLTTGRRTWCGVAAVLLGVALAAKLSCVALVPVFGISLLWDAWHRSTAQSFWRCVTSTIATLVPRLAGVAIVAYATIWAAYAFEVGPYYPADSQAKLEVLPEGRLHRLASAFLHEVPLPAPSYLRCWIKLLHAQSYGHDAFLHGQHSRSGWWYYYLVASALKTPLALFLLLGLAAVPRVRRANLDPSLCLTVILPVAVLLLMAIPSTQAVGLRHLLPIYPFLSILAAGSLRHWNAANSPLKNSGRVRETHLFSRFVACSTRPPGFFQQAARGKVALVVLTGWYAVATLSIHPHYLAYFNELSGGPRQAYHWLVDSNLDWGQDLKLLGNYLRQRKIDTIALAYFGNARPEYYGIHYTPMPVALGVMKTAPDADPPMPTSGLVAISATEFQDVYSDDKQRYAWLRHRQPVDHVGYSILIFDLDSPPAAAP